VRHAQRFTLAQRPGYTLLTVNQAWVGSQQVFTYALVPQGQPIPANLPAGATVLAVPVQRMVGTSTTHAALLELLGQTDKLAGFTQTQYLCGPQLRQRLASGQLKEVGAGNGGLNLEAVLGLQPDLVMAYGMDGSNPAYERLRTLGVPALLNADYMENSPLGRAEWIKVAGLLVGQAAQADSLFNAMEKAYLSLAQLAGQQSVKPKVLASAPYGDIWFMPGGRSFPARLIADAGGDFLWATDTATGSQRLSLEAVFAQAQPADVWVNINPGNYPTVAALVATDARFAHFAAVKTGQLYNNDAQVLPSGGNAYWELGAVRPDLVLADLVRIFHPGLLPQHQLYFYRQLPAQ
jgi:iron complex transport system substrate-binding protein